MIVEVFAAEISVFFFWGGSAMYERIVTGFRTSTDRGSA